MKDKARPRATYYSLVRDILLENHPKIFSFMLILALISLTGLAAYLVYDILSFGSDSTHKGVLAGVNLQDREKSILAILTGNDVGTNHRSQYPLSEPNKGPNNPVDANSSIKEKRLENRSLQVDISNSSPTTASISQSRDSVRVTSGVTASSSSNSQSKKRNVSSLSRKSGSSASSNESSRSAKESNNQLNQTQANSTQQIQTVSNQLQRNRSPINYSQFIQVPSNYSQSIQLQSNNPQVNTSQASEPKIEISSGSNISGNLLAAEAGNIETKNIVNLSSQNISVSFDIIPVDSSAGLAFEDKAQKDLAVADAAIEDNGLNQARAAVKSREVRMEFKTDSSTEPKSENVQKPEALSGEAASSSINPPDLQVTENIQAKKIDAVAESPKSSTIKFKPEPQKKDADSGKKNRITTSPSRTQKKPQIAKTHQTTNRNTLSTNLKKNHPVSGTLPAKKPSG